MKTKKTDRRILKTRKALFDAFDRLIRAKDYDKITISELAREADIDRKTFYLHYPSIDAMLDDRLDAIVEGILDAVESDMHCRMDASDGAKVEFDLHVFFTEVSKAVRGYVPMRDHIFAAMPAGVLADKLARPMVREMRRRGSVRLEVEDDLFEVCVSSLMGAVLGAYSAWLEGGMAISDERVSNITSRMIGACLREFSAERC
ncbi:MAG: TetR/AcrR family transcriptional regulator [Slackia sp.]|nr:TetR/AcrR family transcriptional regulator [Slackia sp.]